ncbi:unnamed protein product [Allacma fusca]|uniref:Uncharacterized protein n=1 Tax=Allacma fusca TaxID=39272 RepID=A0A8J2LYI1_9HEXA|nr:unnamed protein product [Allacma fusca]
MSDSEEDVDDPPTRAPQGVGINERDIAEASPAILRQLENTARDLRAQQRAEKRDQASTSTATELQVEVEVHNPPITETAVNGEVPTEQQSTESTSTDLREEVDPNDSAQNTNATEETQTSTEDQLESSTSTGASAATPKQSAQLAPSVRKPRGRPPKTPKIVTNAAEPQPSMSQSQTGDLTTGGSAQPAKDSNKLTKSQRKSERIKARLMRMGQDPLRTYDFHQIVPYHYSEKSLYKSYFIEDSEFPVTEDLQEVYTVEPRKLEVNKVTVEINPEENEINIFISLPPEYKLEGEVIKVEIPPQCEIPRNENAVAQFLKSTITNAMSGWLLNKI